MTLASDLLLPPEGDPEPCTFGRFIRDSEYSSDLSAAVDKIRSQRIEKSLHNNTGYTVAWLLKILLNNGVANYSKDQITRHVRLDCSCRLVTDESR